MKQLFFLLFTCFTLSPTLFAQQQALQQFMEQHKNTPAFTYAFLSKDLFEVASKSEVDHDDWAKLRQVMENIGSLRILAADSIQTGLAMFREARALVPVDEFDELVSVRDGQSNVRIWARSENSKVTDLVLLVGSSDAFALVCFAGNLELDNLPAMAQLFEGGAAKQLAQTAASVSADFTITPNPANDAFVMNYPDQEDRAISLTLIDPAGRQVFEQHLADVNSQQVLLREVPAGNYWVQIKTRQGKVGVKQLQIVR